MINKQTAPPQFCGHAAIAVTGADVPARSAEWWTALPSLLRPADVLATSDRSRRDSPGPIDTTVQYSSCLAKTSLPGFGRRCHRARAAALLPSHLDFLQGTFEKI